MVCSKPDNCDKSTSIIVADGEQQGECVACTGKLVPNTDQSKCMEEQV